MITRQSLWIVNHFAAHPRDPFGGQRHQALGARLAELGWDVSIVAASTTHGTGAQRASEALVENEVDGVRWVWLKTPEYTGGALMRVANMLVFTYGVLARRSWAPAPDPDVIIGSTVHPLAAWAAYRVAKRRRIPFVFEVRDLWPETLIDMGAIPRRGLAAWLLRRLERTLYRSAKRTITTMPAAYRYIERFGVHKDQVVWISNGVPEAEVQPPTAREESAGPFVLAYSGSLGDANAVDSIVRAMKVVRSNTEIPEVHLEVAGDGPRRGDLEKLAASLGLQGVVTFKGAIPKSEVPAFLAESDAAVISLLPLPLYRYGISMNKLFEYLSSGRPVLLAGDPVNNPVADADAGVWVSSNSPDSIAAGITTLVTASSIQRASWGENGRRYVLDRFTYERLGDQLDELLRAALRIDA